MSTSKDTPWDIDAMMEAEPEAVAAWQKSVPGSSSEAAPEASQSSKREGDVQQPKASSKKAKANDSKAVAVASDALVTSRPSGDNDNLDAMSEPETEDGRTHEFAFTEGELHDMPPAEVKAKASAAGYSGGNARRTLIWLARAFLIKKGAASGGNLLVVQPNRSAAADSIVRSGKLSKDELLAMPGWNSSTMTHPSGRGTVTLISPAGEKFRSTISASKHFHATANGTSSMPVPSTPPGLPPSVNFTQSPGILSIQQSTGISMPGVSSVSDVLKSPESFPGEAYKAALMTLKERCPSDKELIFEASKLTLVENVPDRTGDRDKRISEIKMLRTWLPSECFIQMCGGQAAMASTPISEIAIAFDRKCLLIAGKNC